MNENKEKNRLKKRLSNLKTRIALIAGIALFGTAIGGPIYSYHGTETVVAKITDKTTKRYDGGTDKYIVEARIGDKGVKVTDS